MRDDILDFLGRNLKYTSLFFSLLVFLSCQVQGRQTVDPWVIGLYMSADFHDLHRVVMEDIREIEDVKSDDVVTIVLVDRYATAYSDPSDTSDWSDTRAYRISNGIRTEIAIPRLGLTVNAREELDMGQEETLKGFTSYIEDNYSDHKKLMVLWGHGDGYKSLSSDGYAPNVFRGIAYDSAGDIQTNLTITELGKVFSSSSIDIIALDACIGANIEVIYELKNTPSIFIASQENVRITGWDYSTVIESIVQSDREILTVARFIVRIYNDTYGDFFPYSAVLPSRIGSFATDWDNLLAGFDDFLGDEILKEELRSLLLNRSNLFPKTTLWIEDDAGEGDAHVDVYNFLQVLRASFLFNELSSEEQLLVENLENAISRVVIAKEPDGPSHPGGMSLYLGKLSNAAISEYDNYYKKTGSTASSFISDTRWSGDGFLKELFID